MDRDECHGMKTRLKLGARASAHGGCRAALGIAIVLCLVPVFLRDGTTDAEAQTAPIQHVYDDQGRLEAVIDPNGNVAVYKYDAVGNLLEIIRTNAPGGAVAITLVSPGSGKVGRSVEVFGKGFSSTPSSNVVAFNGVAATVTAAAPNRLATTVPPGATTGVISVTVTGVGSANSPSAFTVIGTLTVTPTTEVAPLNVTRQFQALLGGSPTSSVVWTVNGVAGGNATVGTVSATGLYTAPATAPAPPRVTVTAIHNVDRTASASATVTIIPGQGVTIGATGAAGGVSVQFGNPPAGTKFLFRGGICVVEGGVCTGGDVTTEPTSGQVIGYMKTASGSGTVAVYRSTCYSSAGGTCTGWGLTTDSTGSPPLEGHLSSTLPSGGIGLKLDGGLLLRGLSGTQSVYLWTTAP